MKAEVSSESEVIRMVERLVPVSDFSKGKTSHIFDDVKNNNAEYIILKNNQPTAVLISMEDYKKVKRLQMYLERIDDEILFARAIKAQSRFVQEEALSLEEIMIKHGIDPAEVDAAVESVEIE